MNQLLTVRDLIKALQDYDQDLHFGVEANGHS